MPTEQRRRGPSDHLARRGPGEEPRDPDRREQERHRQRQEPYPGLSAVRPREIDRNSGTTKKRPAWMMNWKKNIVSPPNEPGVASRSSGAAAAGLRGDVLLPRDEQAEHDEPGRDEPAPSRNSPTQDGPPGSKHPSPLPGAEHAEHAEPETEGRQGGADEVEAEPLLRLGIGDPAGQRQDADDQDDLPGEHVAPGPVRGGYPADQRPRGDGDRAGRGTRPYALGRSAVPKLKATSATIAGMISAAPRPSRTDQPRISTGRLWAIEVTTSRRRR